MKWDILPDERLEPHAVLCIYSWISILNVFPLDADIVLEENSQPVIHRADNLQSSVRPNFSWT